MNPKPKKVEPWGIHETIIEVLANFGLGVMSSLGVFGARFYNRKLLKEEPKPGNDLGWTNIHIGTMVKILEYI